MINLGGLMFSRWYYLLGSLVFFLCGPMGDGGGEAQVILALVVVRIFVM